jgi:hypothetical protein
MLENIINSKPSLATARVFILFLLNIIRLEPGFKP